MLKLRGSRYYKLLRAAPLSAKMMTISGSVIVAILIFLMFFGNYVAPYDPLAFSDDVSNPPCWKHPFGTDSLGRDVLSRLIVGSYWSLGIALIAVAISMSVGTFLGAISGYLGGNVDRILTLVMDALWVFPTFILALVVAMVMGPGMINTAFAVAVVAFPVFFRVIRALTLTIKERGFIEAEKMIGADTLHIIRRHISPFYASSFFVLASLRIARAILTVSGLGFLGLGIPPPTPEWGTELAMGRFEMLHGSWWLSVFPGLMILTGILGFNMLSEGLDEALKPVRERRR